MIKLDINTTEECAQFVKDVVECSSHKKMKQCDVLKTSEEYNRIIMTIYAPYNLYPDEETYNESVMFSIKAKPKYITVIGIGPKGGWNPARQLLKDLHIGDNNEKGK